MKKTLKALCIAVLAVLGAVTTGCTGQLEEIPEQDRNVITLTTTITLGGNSESKALTANGVKTFAKDDQIVVVYKNTGNETVKAVSNKLIGIGTDISADGKKATITVTLENPLAGGAVRYIYPAAMAKGTIEAGATINDANTINYDALAAQDGTLTTLASNLDLAVYDGNLTGEAALPTSVMLTNQLCIGEFTIKNSDGSSDLTSAITGLWVSDGTNTYAVTRSASAGPIYVAMRPIADATTITFAAQTASAYYEREVADKTLAAGNMYPVGVRMTQTHSVNLARLCNAYEAQSGETLTGKLALCRQISIASGATVTLNNVDINGDNTFNGAFPGIKCTGKATLTLVGTNTVRGCKNSGYPGIYPRGTLTINGTGKLFAYSNGNGAAGIGGGKYPYLDCGKIVIQSGEITAEATSSYGAGIGTSGISGSNNSCGDITITGGTVIATGGYRAAGIGTGCAQIGDMKSSLTTQCGNISISGGTVSATGGSGAAGIGLGYTMPSSNNNAYKIENTCGTIIIESTVTRVTANRGAGAPYCIGKGALSNVGNSPYQLTCGTITIGGESKGNNGVSPTSGDEYVYQ